jgi:hypothetical protein
VRNPWRAREFAKRSPPRFPRPRPSNLPLECHTWAGFSLVDEPPDEPRARPKSWFSPLFLPDSSSVSHFTAGAFEIFILSQLGECPERYAESFINTTLSKLEHNSNHRPAPDAKSGPEKTSAPSRDSTYWLA